MGESDYSFSLTTFSPSGRLVQIEYALNAVTAGATALGIKGKFSVEGLLLGVVSEISSANALVVTWIGPR